jgi:TRAP-type C4-dicarboxylate transport system permease small subunit
MSPHVPSSEVGIVVVKTLTLVLGGLITYYSYQAYQRTAANELRTLTIGFGIITLGAFLGGLLHLGVTQFVQVELVVPVFIESLLITTGLGVILYSLYER